jgi:uncharacterized protein with PQ loop repeat
MSTIANIVGYAGAALSLLVGAAQLWTLLRKRRAEGVSTLDYVVRIVATVLLGVYSISMRNWTFIIVNFGSALLSAAVFAAATKIRHAQPQRA